MKKYFIALFLSTMIIPSVAYASWWNPFSWGIFHRTNTSTQVLENRIKELEDRLEITTGSADVRQHTGDDITRAKKETNNIILQEPKPVVGTATPAIDYEALYKDINDKYFTMRKKVESEIYVVDDSLSGSSNIPKNYLNFLQNLRIALNSDDLALTKVWNVTPKPADTVNFYVSKYTQTLNDYNIQRKIYDNYLSDLANDKLTREKIAAEEQESARNDYVEKIKIEIAKMNQMKVQIRSSIGLDQSFFYGLNATKKLNGDPLFYEFQYSCGFDNIKFTYPYWYKKYETNACRGAINSKIESIIDIYIAFLRVELAKNE